MSDTKVSMIVKLKADMANYVQQRDQVSLQFQQLQGAIFACDKAIKDIEEEVKAHLEELTKSTGESNGEANSEGQESSPQE